MENNELVTKSNIEVDKKVIDDDGNIGVIIGFDKELHDVYVEFELGGVGIYCLNEGCKEKHEIKGEYFETYQYDPLYYIK